jgi:Na+/melibiose symporter-like transporter
LVMPALLFIRDRPNTPASVLVTKPRPMQSMR